MTIDSDPVTPKSDPDDPFEPENPEDPIGIGDPIHPEPVDPDDPSTLRPGIPYPSDPPAPPIPPAPPPDLAKLAAVRQTMTAYQDEGVSRVQGIARSGRDSFADLWTLTTTASLRKAKDVAKKKPDAKDKLTAFQAVLNQCHLKDALDQWCALRNSANPDLGQLAGILISIENEATPLIKAFDKEPTSAAGGKANPQGIDLQMDLLATTAKGLLTTIASEADILLGGGRVPAAGHGEAICGRLEYGTADGNWRQKLESVPSWKALGSKIERNISLELMGGTGTLDNGGRARAMTVLDNALAARRNPPPGSTPEQLRTALVAAYTGVVDAIRNDIAQVQARRNQLDKGNPPKGWTKDQCQRAIDLLVGSMRVVKDELGADALATDPDAQAVVRNLQLKCKTRGYPTTQESLAAEAKTNFGKFWRDGRNAELKALTKLGSEDPKLAGKVNRLKTKFDKDFGPSLTAWSAEVAKFPDHDRDKMHDLAVKIATTISAYRDAVTTTVGDDGAGLRAALDAIASGVAASIRSYQVRGGLFG